MEKTLAEIYDLRQYRDNLLQKINKFVPKHFVAHTPSFTCLTQKQINCLDNLDKMRKAATKYATGKLKSENPQHIALVKNYLKIEMLDLSIRNERVALLDEITRAHSVLNKVSKDTYPEAQFLYPDTLNSYTPYISVLQKESI